MFGVSLKKLLLFLIISSPVFVHAGQTILSTTTFSTSVIDNVFGVPVWLDPQNAQFEDAIVSTNSSGIGSYLESTAYGFNIPTSSTILGIKAEIKKKESISGMGDQSVLLIKPDGSYTDVDHASADEWLDTLTWAVYGSATDTWGRKWSASEINSAGFGSAIQSNRSTGSGTGEIDAMRITIYYIPNPHIINSGIIKSGILQ